MIDTLFTLTVLNTDTNESYKLNYVCPDQMLEARIAIEYGDNYPNLKVTDYSDFGYVIIRKHSDTLDQLDFIASH